MDILVTAGFDNGSETMLRDTHEGMRVRRRAHSIDRDGDLKSRKSQSTTTCRKRKLLTLPSVPFLKPIGKETPLASSRCNCDSVVRAPIAPQVVRSEMYCGEIVSRSSEPTGKPRLVKSHKS